MLSEVTVPGSAAILNMEGIKLGCMDSNCTQYPKNMHSDIVEWFFMLSFSVDSCGLFINISGLLYWQLGKNLWMRPASEGRRYILRSFLIGWAHT